MAGPPLLFRLDADPSFRIGSPLFDVINGGVLGPARVADCGSFAFDLSAVADPGDGGCKFVVAERGIYSDCT
jgi:hypothetical protein